MHCIPASHRALEIGLEPCPLLCIREQGLEVDAGRLSHATGHGSASHHAKQVQSDSPGLVAYWPFDEVRTCNNCIGCKSCAACLS